MFKFQELMCEENVVHSGSFKYYENVFDDEELYSLTTVFQIIEDYADRKIYKNLDFSIVVCEGGGEGGGETVVRVMKVVDYVHNEIIYLRRTGYYASYDGTTWDDDFEQVFPEEVKVIKFKNSAGDLYEQEGEV